VSQQPGPTEPAAVDFAAEVRPVLAEFCFRCHGPDRQKGDIRLDTFDPDLVRGPDAEAWHAVLDMIEGAEMPPEDEPQPGDAARRRVVDWLRAELERAAQVRRGAVRTVLRRLNKQQYTNTLQDLLGVVADFGRPLPDDGKSRLGFGNSGEVLQASPLHIETWQASARRALEAAIVVGDRPPVTRYRVTFGAGLGVGKVAARIGGYQAEPLDPADFAVEILGPDGEPLAAADPAGQQALDAVRRRIGVGLRGSSTDRFRAVEDGMILFGALPHVERVPKSWQGPSPNLKLELQRCFPEQGDFVMRVRASRGYVPPLLEQILVEPDRRVPLVGLGTAGDPTLPDGAIVLRAAESRKRDNLRAEGELLLPVDVPLPSTAEFQVAIPRDGFYQVDLVHPATPPDQMPSVRLSIGGMKLDHRPALDAAELARPTAVTAIGVCGLRAGRHPLRVGGPFFVGFREVVLSPLDPEHPQVRRLGARAEQLEAAQRGKKPVIRAFVGTRTDDGMDYRTFGEPVEVLAPLGAAEVHEFHGRLEDLPIPEPESGDTEVLSGIMLIGLWNEHLVRSAGETGPPLLVESIEVEAPHLPVWPPESHRRIFFPSPHRDEPEVYAREVIARFVERAFRRPVAADEVDRYHAFWREVRADFATFEEGIRETLVAVLCSPHFLHLVEDPVGDPVGDPADRGPLSEHGLANRLAYFLWNSPPDEPLLALARQGRLRGELLRQVDRLLDDPRRTRFVRTFAREWLRLDRLDQVTIDVGLHPAFTRFVERDMGEEAWRFVEHLVDEDRSLFDLVDADFAMLNQNLAGFYGIDGVEGPAFRPVPLEPAMRRGGLLSQGAFLAGHSDGSWPHPIKRAVFVKEKILGERPPAPPPNVPDLDPDTPGFEKLTLKEQLELHRQKASCLDCHQRLDPFGLALEEYGAVGLLETRRRGRPVDASTVLPDGTPIDGVDALKRYILERRGDDFAAALIEHLFAYALGRDTSFADEAELAGILEQVRIGGYRMRTLIRAIVSSPSFTSR
jgi:hypothetical protein